MFAYLIAVGGVSPGGRGITLAVVVKGVKVGGRAVLSVQVCRGNGWRHPLVICEERHKSLSSCFGVVPVGPVSVHEPRKDKLGVSQGGDINLEFGALHITIKMQLNRNGRGLLSSAESVSCACQCKSATFSLVNKSEKATLYFILISRNTLHLKINRLQ